MDIENFKSQIRETIAKDFPGGFMEFHITNGVEKHRTNYREYISLNPWSSFEEWKSKLEKSVNTETINAGDLLSIGLFLLSLDEFKPDE